MAAPKTVLTYPLNGAQRDFPIPFEYLARKFVVVTLIGKTRQTLTLNSDYRFTARTTITTTKAWGPGDLFTSIELRRVTSATERLVDFADGSILRAYDLNTSQMQSLHIAEEARDLTADTIGVNNDGDLDARGRKIVNVADGIADGDAVNLRQQKAWAGSALNQADRAVLQANAAAESARLAGIHNYESKDAATRSDVSRVQSENAQINSQNARDKARQWAEANDGVQVEPNMYSAKAWAKTSQYHGEKAQTNNEQSRVNNEQSYQNAVQSGGNADRAKGEADRAKTEADKLGNANAFMGTILDVRNLDTRFKGTHQIKQALYVQRQSSDDVNDFVSLSFEPNSVWYTRDSSNRALTSLDLAGNYASKGSITADGGSVTVRSPVESANSHYWFEGPGGNRGVIYAGTDQNIRIRAGRERLGLSITPDGHMIAGGSIYMQGATIPSNADIRADWLQGGSLYSALSSVKSGTRIRNVPTVIWERGVDTAGGSGDQGAAGSSLYLREGLMPGDFYMFEIYGGAKFYSTTNCIPYGDSTSEEHNVQFDSGGAMLFVLTEGGRRITVRAGKPNNQYGIRRVFLFKLQLA